MLAHPRRLLRAQGLSSQLGATHQEASGSKGGQDGEEEEDEDLDPEVLLALGPPEAPVRLVVRGECRACMGVGVCMLLLGACSQHPVTLPQLTSAARRTPA